MVCPTLDSWKNDVKLTSKHNLGLHGTNVWSLHEIYSYEKAWFHWPTNNKNMTNQPCKPWQINLAFIDSIVKIYELLNKEYIISCLWFRNPDNHLQYMKPYKKLSNGDRRISEASTIRVPTPQTQESGPATRGENPRRTKHLRLGNFRDGLLKQVNCDIFWECGRFNSSTAKDYDYISIYIHLYTSFGQPMKFLAASWPKSSICILVCQKFVPCRVSGPTWKTHESVITFQDLLVHTKPIRHWSH